MKISLPSTSLLTMALLSVVKSASPAVAPLDIVFAVDESGSMSSAQAGVQAQVSSMFAQLTAQFPTFRMGLVGFGEGDDEGYPVLRHNLTRNQATFQQAVDNLEVSGGYEPGYLSVVQIAANSVAGKSLNVSGYPGPFPGTAGYCVVLISDEASNGGYSYDDATYSEALNALTSTQGHFYAITAGDQGYNALAAATNGTSHYLYSFISDSAPVLKSIIDTCVTTVTLAKCGDGVKDAIEECDDGNIINGDGCSSNCKIETAACTKTTYWLWNPKTDKQIGQLLNNSKKCIAVPYNIEVRPCTIPKTPPVRITLQNATKATIKTQPEYFTPYYLWGDKTATGDVWPNKKPLPKGTYYLNSKIDGKSETITFQQTC